MEFNFLISSGIKTLPIDPVFSGWVIVIKKAPVIYRSRNSKSLKGIFFFFEIRYFEIKTLPFDPVFSGWVIVITKAPVIYRSRNSKSL